MLRVLKEGANRGRLFVSCDDTCRYFAFLGPTATAGAKRRLTSDGPLPEPQSTRPCRRVPLVSLEVAFETLEQSWHQTMRAYLAFHDAIRAASTPPLERLSSQVPAEQEEEIMKPQQQAENNAFTSV